MQLRTIIEVGGCVVALFGGFEYVAEREAGARLSATLEAQKQALATLQADRDKHAADDRARDAQTASMIASWQQAAAQLKTPQQQAAWSQQQLEAALKGIQITLNPKTGEAVATLPAATLPELPQVIERCRECDAKLATAQADLQSRAEQQQLADLQIKALQKERDAAVVAARGGTKWQRTVRALKWLGIGAGVGYVAAKAR